MNITLDKLQVNKEGKIINIKNTSNVRRRLLDLGMIKESKIKALYHSPFNDPVAYLIRGTVIALRKEDAKNILISCVGDNDGIN
ncbi:MAG: FeoA family protein [Bacilli bacterium]